MMVSSGENSIFLKRKTWKKQQPQHICKFNKTNKTLDLLFPENLRFGKLRKKFRESLLISEENGRRRCTAKGTAGYLFEKEKHLTQHYYMIHPYSKFRERWEIAVMLEIILGITFRGFLVTQMPDSVFSSWFYQVAGLMCDLFEMTDSMVLRFLTGYLDSETRTVALETSKVFFWNVKKIYTHLNIITSLPYDFLIFVCIPKAKIDAFPALRLFVLIKILKLPLIYRYLVHISKIYNWTDLTARGVWIALFMLVLSHWLTCLFSAVIFGNAFGEVQNAIKATDTPIHRHFRVFYLIATIFFFQNGIPNNFVFSCPKDLLFYVLLLITINLSNIAIIGILIQILGLRSSSFIQYEEMIQEVQKYLIQENLPKRVHKKVIKYFEFRFRHRYFREKIILDTLSPPLRQEIAKFLCMNLLLGPGSVFQGIPEVVAIALCLKMKFEVYLAGDVIVSAGKEAKKIYFIYCGTVALFSPRGKELGHLYVGSQFGTSCLSLEDKQYGVTAIALESSECYVLRHRDFIACTSDYPECRSIVSRAINKDSQHNIELTSAQ